jgi:hypothetical protein
MVKLKELDWHTALWFIITIIVFTVTVIVLIVVASLMCATFLKSTGQTDFGHLPLEFVAICITLAGLFFGVGQKLFHDLKGPGNEHIKVGVLYILAGILVATFTFTYPGYSNMQSSYDVYSIPLCVVGFSLVAGVVTFVVAAILTIFFFLLHFIKA